MSRIDKRHDQHDHRAVKGGDRPAKAMVSEPETPYTPHVEHEGDDADRKPDSGPGSGRGPEHAARGSGSTT